MKGWGLVTIAALVLAAGCVTPSAPAIAPTLAPAPPKVAPTSASSSSATEIAPPTETLAPTQTLTPTMTTTWTPIPMRAATNAVTWTPAPTLRPLSTATQVIVIAPTAPPAGGGGACCKHCGTTSKPCGDTCISLKFTCNTPPGCACP